MTNAAQRVASPLSSTTEVDAFIQRGREDGTLQPGGRLPTEREFAQILGVSRASIRRALAHQEALGAVVRHQGRGTFLAPDDRHRSAVPVGHETEHSWTDTSPSEVLVVRCIFEPQIAFLAAQSATERDLERIERCLRETIAAPGFEEFEVWDGAFHRSIAEAAHNSFLLGIFDHINRVRGELRWGRLKRRSLTPDRREAYEFEHGAVVNAIRERDGEQARALMSRHLTHVRDNMLSPDRAEIEFG